MEGEPKSNEVIMGELEAIMMDLVVSDPGGFQKMRNKKAEELSKKYPGFNTIALYHLLIDSNPVEGSITEFDFPGDDSIEKFLRDQ
ncbi:MAG: hypothetical protein NTV02_00425 [Candidatus Zambryskibacteria bacterium]|nr:hypothetical protein [Candidatus Zambryskibacteria bacterium]